MLKPTPRCKEDYNGKEKSYSKVTMDIYAKVKYNKPWELATVVNEAFQPTNDIEENPAS